MIENKAVLTGSMLVTFLSGAFVGHVGTASAPAPANSPRNVETIYATHFDEARAKGYGDAEIAELHVIYEDYLKGYQVWWDTFLEAHSDSLDLIDKRFYERVEVLDAEFQGEQPEAPGPEKEDRPGK